MSHGTALWKTSTAVEEIGTLALAGDGTLTLTSPTGSVELALELSTSPFLDVYATPEWFCAVGAADRQLVVGRAAGPTLEVIVELERLGRGGRYDSGAHAVRFHDRPDHDQCVLAWEIGVALLDPRAGIVWQYVHDDVDQRVVGITAGAIELMGAEKAISVSLGNGAARERPVGHRS